jgi:hypothetical protein
VSRLINRPVRVVERAGVPLRFRYHGEHEVVDVVEEWRETGEWWRGEGERRVLRLRTRDGGFFELLFDRREGWILTRAYD